MKEQLLTLSPDGRRGVEFLGELDSSFMTYSDLSTQLGVTQGTLNNTTQKDKWLRFKLDGVELVVSKGVIRNSISWDYLYSKGLVYGTNDNGVFPTGTLTNQLRTVNIAGNTYKVRLLKGADTDPSDNLTGADLIGTQESEWSRLFYPIVIDDPSITSYTGPKLASYTIVDLDMDPIVTSRYIWCQERHGYSTSWRVNRGMNGPSSISTSPSNRNNNTTGWRPCLELIN